jgi:hypothetical protein
VMSHSLELPAALRQPEFRFIKLGAEGQRLKVPIEAGWNILDIGELKSYIEKKSIQWDNDKVSGKNSEMEANGKRVPKRPEFRGKLNNYSYDDPEFQEWLKKGKNYGVTAAGGLIKLESDDIERWKELGVMELLPETFTVQSSTPNRKHFYYIGPDIADSPLIDPKTGEDIGHIRGTGESGGRGGMVVGPGSLHPSGTRYTIIKDIPIATITIETLNEVKTKLSTQQTIANGTKQKRIRKNDGRSKNVPRQNSDVTSKIRIEDIAKPVDPIKNDGEEIQGSHPIHGSGTGKNFSINPGKNTWHCFRCDSGGGPLEWIAVEAGLINCSDAGPGCLRGELFKQVLDIARGRGYDIPDLRRSCNQVRIIENRIMLKELPEELPLDPVVVVKGPPRIGKTHWSVKQLLKAGSGNYITHTHSIVTHALHIFEKEGGQSAVHLEGKNRPGMCRKDKANCTECELYPNQHDDSHISYTELERSAEELLRKEKILTKDKVPYDLCPYYTLKLAEKSAQYSFTVPHFLEDLKPRHLLVLDEDPTLSHFYPPSPMIFRYKKEKNEIKFDNALGTALEQAPEIKERIESKENRSEEDKALGWAIDTIGGINEIIKTSMSGECTTEKCYEEIKEHLTEEPKVTYDAKTIEKALKNLDKYQMDCTSDVDLRDYICSLFHIFKKKPLSMLSAGRSGYKSMHMIGDASSPVINMHWSSTTIKPGCKILIIGNTLAELFGKALGNAVIIEIHKFKYARNYVVIPVDSNGENTQDGKVKKQRLKVTKLIKAVANDPDSKNRHPVMVLTGSKRNQSALIRSLGGICHAAQEEGEIGQKWNHKSGMVNVFYQNSTISRGLDVDQYNVLFVHDVDFAQPFWSAAVEAGEDNAKDILNSIIMDETTNSVLRISPVVGGNELRPKIVIVPRIDLMKIRYLDDQISDGNMPGRTPDIKDIAAVIRESNLAGTVDLNDDGISVDDKLRGQDWELAAQESKLLDKFRSELDRICSRDKYTDEELDAAKKNILNILKNEGRQAWVSIDGMREKGLKCKDSLIRPALRRLYNQGMVKRIVRNRQVFWRWHPIS